MPTSSLQYPLLLTTMIYDEIQHPCLSWDMYPWITHAPRRSFSMEVLKGLGRWLESWQYLNMKNAFRKRGLLTPGVPRFVSSIALWVVLRAFQFQSGGVMQYYVSMHWDWNFDGHILWSVLKAYEGKNSRWVSGKLCLSHIWTKQLRSHALWLRGLDDLIGFCIFSLARAKVQGLES